MIDQNTSFVIFNINCTMPCKTCSNIPTACMSCYNISTVNTNNLLFAGNNTCLANCPSGYYATTDLMCIACSSTCLTCSITSNNCTSCNLTSAYPALNITNYTGSCLTSCPNTFYLNRNATPPQCTPCDSTINRCYFCTDINICTKCATGYYLQTSQCVTTCLINVSIQNNSTWTCDLCSIQCASCSTSINNCTSCAPNAA
jgi:proprotein convertase subtilisin/kexin type 5